MKINRMFLSSMSFLMLFAGASLSQAADAPTATKTETAQDQGHIMMDHSTGDQKSMNKMKDKNVKVHHDGDAPSATGDGTTDHVMMDHSSGDQKAMSKMKEKPHVHHKGDAASSSESSATEHMMMDHSTGDQKSMNRMKDKKIPVHKSESSSSASATDVHREHHEAPPAK